MQKPEGSLSLSLMIRRNMIGLMAFTAAALFGQQLCGQPVYEVDESFSTGELFKSCNGGVWNLYEREDGEFIVGGAFESTHHLWPDPFAVGHALISPNGERNISDWGGAGEKSIFMTEYDQDHLLITKNTSVMLLRKDGNELLSTYFHPYSFQGHGPWSRRFVGECFVFDDQSVVCAGSLATDSTDQSRFRHLFRFHPDGHLDTDFPAFEGEPNINTVTRGVALRRLSDGSWILAGSFSEINGYHSPHLIKLRPDFEIDTAFVSPFGYHSGWAHPELLLLDSEDNVWMGGVNIDMPSGEPSPHNLYKVSADGEIIADFMPGIIEGIPYVQGVYSGYPTPRIRRVTELNEGNRFVISGRFYNYNGSHAAGLTVVDGNGELQEGYFQNKGAIYDYCMHGPIHLPKVPMVTMVHELDDGSLFVGGGFSEFNTFNHDNNDEVLEEHEHYGLVKLVKNTVSTSERDAVRRVSVYPNPVRDRLYLDYDGLPDAAEIVGVDGRLVKSFGPGHGDMTSFNVGDLPPGMYLLRITDRGRNNSEAVRFIKTD